MKPIQVVGSLSSTPPSHISPSDCDILELRLDSDLSEESIKQILSNNPLPLLITARDIKEGGIKELSLAERISLLKQWLPHAQYVDLELQNWESMQEIIALAKPTTCLTIASYHDFEKTPSQDDIDLLVASAVTANPDIIKFAFYINSLDDIGRCQKLLFKHSNLNISIMGMGAYAPVSRVLLAQSGSILNYGYLGKEETAPGQWPSSLLKSAILSSQPISPELSLNISL